MTRCSYRLTQGFTPGQPIDGFWPPAIRVGGWRAYDTRTLWVVTSKNRVELA